MGSGSLVAPIRDVDWEYCTRRVAFASDRAIRARWSLVWNSDKLRGIVVSSKKGPFDVQRIKASRADRGGSGAAGPAAGLSPGGLLLFQRQGQGHPAAGSESVHHLERRGEGGVVHGAAEVRGQR